MRRFNLAKEERKLNRKINLANNIKIRTIVLSIFVLVGSIMLFTYSKYSTSVNLDIMHSKVANFIQDDYIINAYVDGVEGDFPSKDDGYIVDEVVCNKGATGTWDDDEWGIVITNATEEETECNVYFIIYIEEPEDFNYTGSVQTYNVPATGKYKLEVWGAQGGVGIDNNSSTNSKVGAGGGYSHGIVSLSSNTTLYVYVGGQGGNGSSNGQLVNGGFNGGGSVPKTGHSGSGGGSGGGATDIRIGQDSLYSRVIVAGGAGGMGYPTETTPGAGGGVNGITGIGSDSSNSSSTGGTQTSGGSSSGSYGGSNGASGTFGVGGNGGSSGTKAGGGGGGGGWYGGAGGKSGSSNSCKAGGGGSGYVYTSSTASYYPSGCLLNSSYYLDEAETIDGDHSFPSPSGSNETGHTGNGYARITYVGN